jgi:hypothetical protein
MTDSIKLGYEQLEALRVMRDNPGKEGSEICREVDCSFDELFSLASAGLIDPGMGRVKDRQVHPVITKAGLTALAKYEGCE